MAKKRSKNIIKYRKPFRLNVGLLLFLFLFLYLIILAVLYITKDRVQIYQVELGRIADEVTYTGMILRDEQIQYSDRVGYVNHYVQEGRKVSKGRVVYSVDENGTFSQQMEEIMQGLDSFSDSAIEDLRNELYTYSREFDNMNFDATYSVKNNMELQILDDLSSLAVNSIEELFDSAAFYQGKSDQSGIVSYRLDGLEGVTETDLTAAMFQDAKQKIEYLRSGQLQDAGSAVYKILPNEAWRLAFPVSEEGYQELSAEIAGAEEGSSPTMTIRILSTDQTVTAPYQIFTGSDGSPFCELQIPKYSSEYIGERYLKFQIVKEQETGLKIPSSAVVTESFYQIPASYATLGGNQKVYGFNVQKVGSDTVEFVAPTFYALIDDVYYVNQKEFSAGDRIYMPDSEETYLVADMTDLAGVFSVNRGYAVFRRIEILEEKEGLCLISPDTQYGLQPYDHIILDSTGISEYDVIY